jgi:hypothetical protein
MKKCFRCKESKSYDLFFKHNQTADGYHSWCKSCCRVGNQKARVKINSTIEGRAKVFLQNASKSAQKRGQEFTLTIQDVVDCWNNQAKICAYSGRLMSLDAGRLDTVSIERINSSIGYTPENTILVCQAINRMKSDFTFDQFYEMCADVVKFLGDESLNLSVGAYK